MTSTTNVTVSFDLSSFLQFFKHDCVQGSRLSLIQRSTLIILHQLNFDISQIAHLTHCDPRTIQHWIDYYEEHHSLEDEPRSGRPRVTSVETASAIETPVTTPRIIRSELGIEASARTIR